MGGPGDGFGRRRSSGHARAAAETAGCRLGRRRRDRPRAQLRRPRERPGRQAANRRGKVRSRWVCRSLGGSVGRVWSGDRTCRLGLCLVGLSVRAAALCFRGLSESGFFCLSPCLCAEVGLRLCVCAPFGAIPPSRNPLVLPFRSLVRSRLRSRGYGKRRCRARLRLRLRLRWVVGWVLLVGAQSRTRARVE